MSVDRIQAGTDREATTEPSASPPAPDGVRAWLAVTAPGMLVTRSLVLLALILTPVLTPAVRVEAAARTAAAALLLAHIGSTAQVLRRPGRGTMTILFALLSIDGLLAGLLAGADPGWRGTAVPFAALSLALSFAAAGGAGLAYGIAVTTLGAGAALWSGMVTPLVFSPSPTFFTILDVEPRYGTTIAAIPPLCATALSVEASFAAVRDANAPACAPATRLSLETLFAGRAAGLSSAGLFTPTFLLVCGAIAIGSAVSLLRVRAATHLVAAGNVGVHP